MVTRMTCLLALGLLLVGCSAVLNLFKSTSDLCPSSTDTSHQYFGSPDADALVVFVHGLCGDAKTTWTNPTTHFVFPEELARDFAQQNQPVYVIAFNYVSQIQRGASIASIGQDLAFGIGEQLKKHPYRTLRIVAHSYGGLVARDYVLERQPRFHPQLPVTNVVLLATPNNENELAELGRLVSNNAKIVELGDTHQRNYTMYLLNTGWNQAFKAEGHTRHVLVYAGYEEQAMPGLRHSVTLSSASPFANESLGFQQDHLSIAKPSTRDDVLYRWVKTKLGESLEKTAMQLLNGLVEQDRLGTSNVPQQLLRTVELLEGLHTLTGTESEKVKTHVMAGEFQAALAVLAENEPQESQLVKDFARRRFAQGEIFELNLQAAQANSYYSQAVQLAPSNAFYRYHYGWFLIRGGGAKDAIPQLEQAVRHSRTSFNLYLEGGALAGLGVAYGDLGQEAKAVEFLNLAKLIFEDRLRLTFPWNGELERLIHGPRD
jgi:pimeloyl-ACP methyl ester carboxylesterase